MAKKRQKSDESAPSERTALVLQGGGALGAYQAGVYDELSKSGYTPDWIAGISIGAINAALIAGNPPDRRVERLRAFWEKVSSGLLAPPLIPGSHGRTLFNEASAAIGATLGLPGFFTPRVPPPTMFPPGAPQALSYYDTRPLRQTLEALVDFDRINGGDTRLSLGAVNVRTGNFAYFDSARQRIGPEHVMASGALPPGFPPIEIDGEHYWDGGLVSNTPLQYVLDAMPADDLLIFQVDLFSARGNMPETIAGAAEREKDIRYSSRTRLNTDMMRHRHDWRSAANRLIAKLPAALQNDPDAKRLRDAACGAAITVVHLIHRRKNYQTQSKDYEFSRYSLTEHWGSGQDDVRHTLQSSAWRNRRRPTQDMAVFDLTRDGQD